MRIGCCLEGCLRHEAPLYDRLRSPRKPAYGGDALFFRAPYLSPIYPPDASEILCVCGREDLAARLSGVEGAVFGGEMRLDQGPRCLAGDGSLSPSHFEADVGAELGKVAILLHAHDGVVQPRFVAGVGVGHGGSS